MFKIKISEKELEQIKEYLPKHLRELLDNKVGVILKKRILEQKVAEKRRLRKQEYNKNRLQTLIDRAKSFREDLIKKQTKAEVIFKAKLKSLNIGYEFQKIVYTDKTFYILDFYIPSLNLVIELDGKYHDTKEQKIKDSKRTLELKKLGFTNIKRYSNTTAEKITDLELKRLLQNK